MTHPARSLRSTWLVALCSMLAVACGPAPRTEPEEGRESPTAGAETPAPTGPPASFLPEGQPVLARLDMARVRRSPVAADIESAMVATTTWQSLAGGSGIRPVQDLDTMVIGADGLYATRRVAVLRYVGTEAYVRERLLALSVARSLPLTWTEAEGFAVSSLPVALSVPHSVVLTAAHEIVICPSDDVARVAGVARDHAARRATLGPDAVLEPQLAFAPGELATMISSEAMQARAGYPAPPQAYRLHAMEDDASHQLFLYVHGEFASESDAQTALDWSLASARQYAGEFLVRGAGLSRPLESLTGTRQGSVVDLQTNMTAEEVRRGLGAAALLQMMQQRAQR
ncbi:MAG: hypothetical protein ACK6CU_31820 [Deltaproteobacteria bacterium]|jgi:hypothetical protein